MTGGGSGGHITPILAVAHELKKQSPDAQIIYIGQKGDQLSDIPAADPSIDQVYTVSAGKLRRYADEGWKQLFDVHTQVLNVRDLFRVVAGIWQSYQLIRKLQPDVIFTRGGFVSVPVALGGRFNHVPYITHDSDSIPSLANRLIASKAHTHAVALPIELYPYPAPKTTMVGVPVSANYVPVTPDLVKSYRKELGLDQYKQVVFLTGGGNGARSLNQALVANAHYLLATFPELVLVHIAGRTLEAETKEAYNALNLGADRKRVQVYGFVTDLYRYSGAADVVIGRGSATNLAEFAIQGKACLMVPASQLAWTVKNSTELAQRGAVLELTDGEAAQQDRLGRTIAGMLRDNAGRARLARNLARYARPHAAADLAELVLKVAGEKVGGEGYVRAKV